MTLCGLQVVLIVGCFNPHTHEGCDERNLRYRNRTHVSIHTPTKGVTAVQANDFRIPLVSIHTPTKGVTTSIVVSQTHDIVSIHTPTKGVTSDCSVMPEQLGLVSIHTPTKGVTSWQKDHYTLYTSFNPHTHEGCDPSCWVRSVIFSSFNPHTHEGCDFETAPLLSQ